MSNGLSSKPSTNLVDFDTPSKELHLNHLSKSLHSVAKSINFSDENYSRQSSLDCIIINQKKKKDLFFTVNELKLSDLFDWKDYKNQSQNRNIPQSGTVVTCNNHKIALFRMGWEVFAIDENCPHQGGPLHVGDIETLGEAHILCVICPWHKWRIELKTGKVKLPRGRDKRNEVYPTRVLKDGSIQVGFSAISDKFFKIDDSIDF
ncbi:uncharacterized protein LOC100197559 isoform X1 [Hydra vulgaris]|uniref:uncharacterized protein LOC100197559 isoform X1 n=1 Tax=Hydra vulgaris TaxID=6087 RepID=UPI0001923EDA|nr:uncharacterized protein LOC100197559 [Hydra vulgaris]